MTDELDVGATSEHTTSEHVNATGTEGMPAEAIPTEAIPTEPTATDRTELSALPTSEIDLPGRATDERHLDAGDASLLGLVDRLAAVLERSDLLELEVQAGSTALILRRPEALAQVVTVGSAGSASGAASSPSSAASDRPVEAPERAIAAVKAPLTGIWYSAPTPGSAPFVQAGGEVGVGQVIGLIEAMKLFNEIKSDLAGRVARVAVENGQLVKAKQPLIEVEPL